MNVNQQMKGRRNRSIGELFEKFISSSCEYYWDNEMACIEKTPEPMIPIRPHGERKRGQFIAYYSKQAQPDFKGVLCDGTCIIFDAKYTESDRINQNVVTKKQCEIFDKYEKMGAHCYIVVSFEMQTFYRVPWIEWNRMKEKFGRKYMKPEEMEEYRVSMQQGILFFLEGIELR